MMLVTAFRKFCVGAVVAVSWALMGIAIAQAQQQPTQQQLDSFRNLSPDQQKTLLDSLVGGNRNGSAIPDRKIEFPQTIRPRDLESQSAQLDRDRRLKPGDTLLLYLEIKKFEESNQRIVQLQASQAASTGQTATAQQMPSAAPAGQASPAAAPAQPLPSTTTSPNNSAAVAAEHSPITYKPERLQELRYMRLRIQRRNPLTLDIFGVLDLPETGPVPLAGLTVEEAQERLAICEQLTDFRVTVLRLPVTPLGAAALKPFGYDLFAGSPSTFAPATDVPVPSDYIIGPGDVLHVQLVGNTKGNFALTVDREGKINFPDLGPISVGGMRFDVMRPTLERRVRAQMIGTQASITSGELRSIRVFVLGDAEQPGSYTVSGLSTMTNALFVSGGVKRLGSLRDIQLKRNGEIVTHLDLYDLLLRGDTRSDVRLLPGDVIFIPPIGTTVGLSGEVRRPAIYELKHETTAQEILALAGGATSQADPTIATIDRVDERYHRVTVDVDLSNTKAAATSLRNGDVLRIPGIRPSLEQSVTLAGHVHRAGDFEFVKGMHLSDLIGSLDELKPGADQHYILIRRESGIDRRIAIFSADVVAALAARGSPRDPLLAPRDRVYVFDMLSGRDTVVGPLMRDLYAQSNLDAPLDEVQIGGSVNVPGQYPLEPGMRVSDLIRAGGSMNESAYEGGAELTRYSVLNGESRQTELINIDLKKIRAGDLTADIELRPFDYLVIKEMPMWRQLEAVEIKGEVRFPGKYPIHRGETLRSVIDRAGGLTETAFLDGTVFTRNELKERERKQIDLLATRLQADIAQLSLQSVQEGGKDVGQALAVGQSMLSALKSSEPVGRLVINLASAVRASPGSTSDIVLKDGDLLVIPRQSQEVTVVGEVQSATSHFYRPRISRDEYIDMSGGVTQRADKKRIYVVKADGSVVAAHGNSWFGGSATQMKAGDTVVVPLDAERMRALPLLQAVTSIVSNLAITAAALHSL